MTDIILMNLMTDPCCPAANFTTVQEQAETLTHTSPLIKLFVADTDEHRLSGFTVQVSSSYRINSLLTAPLIGFIFVQYQEEGEHFHYKP